METANMNPLVYRKRTLTNIAAEFVERRAGKEEHFQVSELPSGATAESSRRDVFRNVEFLPETEKFVPKGTEIDYSPQYEESRKAFESFQKTLRRLVKGLKDRGVAEDLKIEIRDPKDFTFQYVLELIEKIQESKSNAARSKSLKQFIRGCWQKVEDNKQVIEGILDIIPTDIYGALISGGFSLILVAVEKNAKERDGIQSFLAEIPGKLDNIKMLSEIHNTSAGLHSSASTVMAAIFEVLERIVDKITRTWKVRLVEKKQKLSKKLWPLRSVGSGISHTQSPMKGNTSQELDLYREDNDSSEEDQGPVQLTVKQSLDNLQNAVNRFQEKVNECAQMRLGRMEERQILMQESQLRVEENQVRMKENLDSWMEKSLKLVRIQVSDQEDLGGMAFARSLATELFKLLASSPCFNTKTGGVDEEELEQAQLENHKIARRDTQARNSRLVKNWTEGLDSIANPMADAAECIQNVDLLSPREKDQSQAILHSEELSKWLKSRKSSILEIELETPPESPDNPVSLTSALIATSISSVHQGPVLAFFARHRLAASRVNELSTPLSLVTSFNAQLLTYLAEHCPQSDLSSIAVEKFYITATKNLSSGLKMFQAQLETLPQGRTVFIIVDCHSSLSGDTDEVFTKLKGIFDKERGTIFKVLVTDPLVGSVVSKIAKLSLWVEGYVPGYGDIDPDESTGEVSQIIKGKGKKRVA